MASGQIKFNAVIGDPDLLSRMRLKQATGALNEFGVVQPLSNLEEILHVLGADEGDRTDVVFASHTFSSQELMRFVESAKQTKFGRDAAYVLLLKNKEQAGAVGQMVMKGFDGFLCEPYSIDQLVEITQLAARIRAERESVREKFAMTLMEKDIMSQLDIIATIKALGFGNAKTLDRLKELAQSVSQLPSESLPMYYDVAMKLFPEAAPPPKPEKIKSYKGVSSRVRDRMGKKISRKFGSTQGGSPPKKGG